MTLRKLIKTIVVLLFLFAVVVGLISINHPIILKWLAGSARHIGKPIHATIYTDGKINDKVQVFYVGRYWSSNKKVNNYLVYFEDNDSLNFPKFIGIDLTEKWIGKPVGLSKNDYDFIAGHLFQNETGGHFIPFQHDIKGFDFDPQLSFSEKQINFKLPPGRLKFDNVKIVF